ncbi:zinc ribbon domain-containing protein [bacterium]|nr:zinc ribbon domain-containing protein [bacterium]
MLPSEYGRIMASMGLDGLRLHASDSNSARHELARVRDLTKRLEDLLGRLEIDARRAKAVAAPRLGPATLREKLEFLLGRWSSPPAAPRVHYAETRGEMSDYLGQLAEAELAIMDYLKRHGAPVQWHFARPGNPTAHRGRPVGPACKNCSAALPPEKVFCPACGLRVI